MKQLNRELLLKRDDLKIEKVQLNKNEYVFVRQMTGRERDQFEQSILRKVTDQNGKVTYQQNLTDFRSKLCVCTVCDEEGKLLLTSEDVEVLSMNMSAYKLEKIITKAQSLNNMTEQDQQGLIKN